MSGNSCVVVGGGIAGVMTALHLQKRGEKVTLIDRWEPGHARAASTDYNRVIRAISGRDEFYTRWARESRAMWLEMQAEASEGVAALKQLQRKYHANSTPVRYDFWSQMACFC